MDVSLLRAGIDADVPVAGDGIFVPGTGSRRLPLEIADAPPQDRHALERETLVERRRLDRSGRARQALGRFGE
jgi:hypothetical protein